MAVPTGGSRSNVGSVYTHVFTGNDNFYTDAALSNVTIFIVGAGGGGSNWGGGGGGGGGFWEGVVSVGAGTHAVAIGRGGNLATGNPVDGEASTINSLGLSVPGGGSAGYGGQDPGVGVGHDGACGGGGSTWNSELGGNPWWHYGGGRACNGGVGGQKYGGGGGGGAGGAGANGAVDNRGGDGGAARVRPSTGVYYCGGGGGGNNESYGGGASGGGGAGAGAGQNLTGQNGTPNTGGGGGGSGDTPNQTVGGSGIVIITYTYIPPAPVAPVATAAPILAAAAEGSTPSVTAATWTGASSTSRRWYLNGRYVGTTMPKVPYGYVGATLQVIDQAQGAVLVETGGFITRDSASNIVTITAGAAPKWVGYGAVPKTFPGTPKWVPLDGLGSSTPSTPKFVRIKDDRV